MMSKSVIRRSWTVCAALMSGLTGSKKDMAMEIAAVKLTMLSGDICTRKQEQVASSV